MSAATNTEDLAGRAGGRTYEKPSLTRHGSLAVHTAGAPGLLLDGLINIPQPS
jgi:hypothetical protein